MSLWRCLSNLQRSSGLTLIAGHTRVEKMNGQSKISKFFAPTMQQQKRANQCESDKSAKKVKQDSSPTKSPIPGKENQVLQQIPSSPEVTNPEPKPLSPPQSSGEAILTLSPEQKAHADQNRTKAKLKLVEKQTHGLVKNVGVSWFRALEPEFSKPYFVNLSKFVAEQRGKATVYPPTEQVFSFTQPCPIRDVKVVILGQDPYHGPGQAHGLCFSVQKGIKPPPSLINMYKELESDIDGFTRPDHGYLMGWATQGVLLLNACLTVKAHNANSHKDQGWEKFTDAVVTWLDKNLSGVVFVLWGSYAQKKGARINKKKHHILKGVHPSPLSAHRGFFGCKHFSQCNELLRKEGKKPIDWSQLSLEC